MEWLQAIFPSIDEGKRDVYRLPGIEPLELLLVMPHIVATALAETWGCSGRREKSQLCTSLCLEVGGVRRPKARHASKGLQWQSADAMREEVAAGD